MMKEVKNIIRFIDGEDVDCILNSTYLWYPLFIILILYLMRDAYQVAQIISSFE